MVNNVVNATYTETYDLNTAIGELSMLGIHTPQAPTLLRNFKGFFMQYKKYKILGCDIRMVCASRQELDPIDVGLEAGKVDPRDVLNPILFKACTNEAMNALLDQILSYGLASNGDAVSAVNSSVYEKKLNTQSALDAYYQLLADDTYRQYHPQSGVDINHLVPMVHKIVTTQQIKTGEQSVNGTAYMQDNQAYAWSNSTDATRPVTFMSNGITPLPWFDTAVDTNSTWTTVAGSTSSVERGIKVINYIPRCYMGCIVLPPAILQSLYFRMKIKWYIQFAEFRPAWEIGPVEAIKDNGTTGADGGINGVSTGYFNIYHTPSSKALPNEQGSFSTTESTDVELVNEVPR